MYKRPQISSSCERHDDEQSIAGADQVLPLAAQFHVVARRGHLHRGLQFLSASATKLPRSRPRTLQVMVIRRWPHSRVIVEGLSSRTSTAASCNERQTFAFGCDDWQLLDELLGVVARRRTAAIVFGQADDQRKPQLSIDDLADARATQCFHQIEHSASRNAVAGELVLFHFDLQDGQASQWFHGHVGIAGNALQHFLDFAGLGLQRPDVVAEELDRQVGAHAGDHLVHAQLDRLRVREFAAQERSNLFFD